MRSVSSRSRELWTGSEVVVRPRSVSSDPDFGREQVNCCRVKEGMKLNWKTELSISDDCDGHILSLRHFFFVPAFALLFC